jgi:hypothetical protein
MSTCDADAPDIRTPESPERRALREIVGRCAVLLMFRAKFNVQAVLKSFVTIGEAGLFEGMGLGDEATARTLAELDATQATQSDAPGGPPP